MKNFSHIYFVGIGGIGMSAIARYFRHEGKAVAGYDRTCTPLTRELEQEGIDIHYQEDVALIPEAFTDSRHTLVVYTPAVPDHHRELIFFREGGFRLVKRSQILGMLSRGKTLMAVAGTHGKTTVTTMVAWFNHRVSDGSAFLGGISKNFHSNLVLGQGDRLAVEADEFDRSFLQLEPSSAVITAIDADHLDIYGTHEAVREAFSEFVARIRPGGALILKNGIELPVHQKHLRQYRYSYDTPSDFYAANIRRIEGGYSLFDLVCPDRTIKDCRLGVPGWINVENAVAATALLWYTGGLDNDNKLREAIATFEGVKRRFEIYIHTPQIVYMDDYAHHPEELRAAITSLREMFPERKLTVIFQPHLFSRTRDFAPEFAEALSLADQAALLPVYPARELPIEGVDSELILRQLTIPHRLIRKEEILSFVNRIDTGVLVTFGAGDIDRYCLPIAETLGEKFRIEP
ncbi:MAG: UDP-N-acetylmuramate--L-alanine ligase [Rikenellaceae bacterium]|nr:UDP-N-acetylmuramate--L-alanine ligase [Rikenellaceae bacterium]